MSLVLVEKPIPHVSVIVLNRPERLNALSFDTVVPLHEALRTVAADNDTWVAVLTGAGRGFCSGLDLEDHGMPPGCDDLPMSRIAIRAMPQPVLAAINGPAYGGGLCLTLGADLRLAAASATFRNAGINNGLTGTELGISWLLPRAIGAAHAWDIILSGRELNAEDALRVGLVSRVVPDAELLPTAQSLAREIARETAPVAVALTKQLIWRFLSEPDPSAAEKLDGLVFGWSTQSPDAKEGIRSFLEKRQPRWGMKVSTDVPDLDGFLKKK